MRSQTFIPTLLAFTLLLTPFHAFAQTKAKTSTKAKNSYNFVTPSSAVASPHAEAARMGKLMMRVQFLGAVNQGIHYFPEDSDILTCLLYAGGATENTSLDDITIRRIGVKELITVDLEDLLEEGTPLPIIKNGDIVSFDFSWRKDITTYATVMGLLTSIAALTVAVVSLSK